MSSTIYSIGHSNQPVDRLIDLLAQHAITAVADVRSQPYSRFAPQYSRDALRSSLENAGIAYVFLGKELGARNTDPACYRDGQLQYDLLAQQPAFAQGIQRVVQGMSSHRIALMCAEKDPINCHRGLLISRKLFEMGIPIEHIHGDGSLETHSELESRMLASCHLPVGDMFKDREYFVAEAYRLQSGQRSISDVGT